MKKDVKLTFDEDNVSRLNNIIKKNKENSPEFIADVIKSDFYYLINNYFEVEFDDVSVQISVDEKNCYDIVAKCKGDRVKLMRRIS